MKKIFLLVLIAVSTISMQSQTLTDIAHAVMGKKVYEIKPTMDSLNIWYHIHKQGDLLERDVIMTVELENGVSFFVKLSFNSKAYDKINQEIVEVTVNFTHDNSGQIRVLNSLSGYQSYHVGFRSTDVYYTIDGKEKKFDKNEAFPK